MTASTILVLIDCKTLLCKRYSGKTKVLTVQASSPLTPYEVEIIRAHPEQIETYREPERA